MSKCKNCVHSGLCIYEKMYDKGSITNCDDYKDKSLFVELPCKVGDKVYLVDKGIGFIGNGTEFIITGYEIYSDCENTYRACCEINKNLVPMTFGDENIGKTVFLTKEEAEAKLKEIEGNEKVC